MGRTLKVIILLIAVFGTSIVYAADGDNVRLVVGRSTVSSDDAVKSALAEASRTLRSVKALDVVSIGLRGDNLDEWGALVRISFLVENVTD